MERLFKAFRDLFAPVRGALYLVVIAHRDALRHRRRHGRRHGGAARHHGRADDDQVRLRRAHVGRRDHAGGTLGILIPPSVMLVVMGPVLGISVLQLYAAAFGPASCSPGCTSLTPWCAAH
jgi:hypothetical protein